MSDVAALEQTLAAEQAAKDEYLADYRDRVSPIVAELDRARADASADAKVAGLSDAEKQAFRDALERDGA